MLTTPYFTFYASLFTFIDTQTDFFIVNGSQRIKNVLKIFSFKLHLQ